MEIKCIEKTRVNHHWSMIKHGRRREEEEILEGA